MPQAGIGARNPLESGLGEAFEPRRFPAIIPKKRRAEDIPHALAFPDLLWVVGAWAICRGGAVFVALDCINACIFLSSREAVEFSRTNIIAPALLALY